MYKIKYKPHILNAFYPQKNAYQEESIYLKFFSRLKQLKCNKYYISKSISKILSFEKSLSYFSTSELENEIKSLQINLIGRGFEPSLICYSFALIRECTYRTLGIKHHPEQIMGGLALINGMLAEMQTGEGKTLTAALAAGTAGLAGIPVHVISANEYLARRDSETLAPVLKMLGLSTLSIQDSMSYHEKMLAFKSNITYCTSSQVAFCYLNDYLNKFRLMKTPMAQYLENNISPQTSLNTILPGLCFAIIDEADTVLADEAKTPLIIAKTQKNTDQILVYKQALAVSELMEKNIDFLISSNNKIDLTNQGINKISLICDKLNGVWKNKRNQSYFIKLALASIHIFTKDKDYIVEDNKITLLNQNTGRTLVNSTWEQGLHQMIELKEKCNISCPTETVAKITYQDFFSRYLHLCGMSGTLKEIKSELNYVYNLQILKVPTNKKCIQKKYPSMMFCNKIDKYTFLVQTIQKENKNGRPILIGTQSISESENISDLLSSFGIKHALLNAKQNETESDIISNAGLPYRITIATNMAGRGTDIKLTDETISLGGLLVIAIEINPSKRVDRQLFGRSGRQGNPGAYQQIYSLEDPIIQNFFPKFLLSRICSKKWVIPRFLIKLLIYLPQSQLERSNKKIRLKLYKSMAKINEYMSFTGNSE